MLGPGFDLIDLGGGRKVVRSVPVELNTDHTDVLQFERHLTLDRDGPKTLLTRYVPIYEMEEVVGKDPDDFVGGLQTFTEQPQERTSIAITLNPEQVGAPGIPRFCFQFLVNYNRRFLLYLIIRSFAYFKFFF